MKQLLYILLFLILAIEITSCQDVESLVKSIAKENKIECEAIGITGSPSNIYKKFNKLKQNANKEQLLALTNHQNLAVRGYSSYALIDKELVKPNKLLLKYIDNNELISTQCGCILDKETLSSLIYHKYWNSRIEYPNDMDFENYILNDSKELQKMDSIILFSEKPYWLLLLRAFENRVYTDNYKKIIEEWAFDRNNLDALKYVFKNLRFGNEERLIKSFDKYTYNDDITLMKNELKQNLIIKKN